MKRSEKIAFIRDNAKYYRFVNFAGYSEEQLEEVYNRIYLATIPEEPFGKGGIFCKSTTGDIFKLEGHEPN
jgi:hypothetical protein